MDESEKKLEKLAGTQHSYKERKMPMKEVPIWEKSNLTLEEAAAYSGIGINKLRSLSDNEHCQFVLWVGSKRLIKRRKLDEYTERMYSL
uniref:excisionase n=1 Tax=Faecalibacterium prausnitzii TaxID=853 RepID=UPI003FEDB81B